MIFSIIIPVYNRPDEIDELLESLTHQTQKNFEIIIVEDGSDVTCKHILEKYTPVLNITYFFKQNTGPGNSRNFGMSKAKGDYYIIFDSDCIIPEHYIHAVENSLRELYVDCFGGPDKALDSFSPVQKAIDFSMTSFLTTGGVRGGSERIDKFQPRSFNMGLSPQAFQATQGFGIIHPGEDPDLSIRLWKLGFATKLIPNAFVYHKRRIDWSKFYIQVNKFGKARPILNSWYPEYSKITYFFPTVFSLGLDVAIVLAVLGWFLPVQLYVLYFMVLLISAVFKTKSLYIACLSIVATIIQFYGYGFGFLKSFIAVQLFKRNPEEVFPELFFKK